MFAEREGRGFEIQTILVTHGYGVHFWIFLRDTRIPSVVHWVFRGGYDTPQGCHSLLRLGERDMRDGRAGQASWNWNQAQ